MDVAGRGDVDAAGRLCDEEDLAVRPRARGRGSASGCSRQRGSVWGCRSPGCARRRWTPGPWHASATAAAAQEPEVDERRLVGIDEHQVLRHAEVPDDAVAHPLLGHVARGRRDVPSTGLLPRELGAVDLDGACATGGVGRRSPPRARAGRCRTRPAMPTISPAWMSSDTPSHCLDAAVPSYDEVADPEPHLAGGRPGGKRLGTDLGGRPSSPPAVRR